MSLDIIRTEIKAILEDITGIGKVHDYERYTHDRNRYTQFFTKGDKVNVWQITRPSFSRFVHATKGATNGVERIIHDFVIEGWYGLNDELASEKTFQNLVELVSQAFRDKPDLNGKAEMIKITSDSPVMGRIFKEMLGEVLCHAVEIRVSIQDRIDF